MDICFAQTNFTLWQAHGDTQRLRFNSSEEVEHVHGVVKHNQTKLRSLVHKPTQLALFMYTDHSFYQGV